MCAMYVYMCFGMLYVYGVFMHAHVCMVYMCTWCMFMCVYVCIYAHTFAFSVIQVST